MLAFYKLSRVISPYQAKKSWKLLSLSQSDGTIMVSVGVLYCFLLGKIA